MFQHNFLSILERERYSFDEINCTTKLLNKNRPSGRFLVGVWEVKLGLGFGFDFGYDFGVIDF